MSWVTVQRLGALGQVETVARSPTGHGSRQDGMPKQAGVETGVQKRAGVRPKASPIFGRFPSGKRPVSSGKRAVHELWPQDAPHTIRTNT